MADLSLSLLVLKTRQTENLRRFYELIGVDLAEEQHGGGPVHFSGRLGDLVLEIYPLGSHAAAADSTTRLGFGVESLPRVMEKLATAGTTVVAKPQETEWGLRAVVRDPDGRSIELYER